MRKMLTTLLLFLTGSIAFNGCAKTIVLHPLTDTDIRMDGNWVCMSPDYVKEIMKVKVGK